MQSRQKSYTDYRRRELSFEVGDFVYLKVSPMRGLRHFKVRGKLAPRFIRPFKIPEKRGDVAYQLELPSQLSDVHDVFHVSQLKKCLCVPEEQKPMEELDAMEDLSYQEYPIKILETSERVMRHKKIKMCKVQWSHHTEEEATWEREDELKVEFTSFFSDQSKSQGRDSFYGGRFVTHYFSKRRESYKFIYLNKYLIIAFHAEAYFSLCCEVLLYFIVQVEVVEIQISLQIIKKI
jgi:hypothetical protein